MVSEKYLFIQQCTGHHLKVIRDVMRWQWLVTGPAWTADESRGCQDAEFLHAHFTYPIPNLKEHWPYKARLHNYECIKVQRSWSVIAKYARHVRHDFGMSGREFKHCPTVVNVEEMPGREKLPICWTSGGKMSGTPEIILAITGWYFQIAIKTDELDRNCSKTKQM